jgi:hypothetical protein
MLPAGIIVVHVISIPNSSLLHAHPGMLLFQLLSVTINFVLHCKSTRLINLKASFPASVEVLVLKPITNISPGDKAVCEYKTFDKQCKTITYTKL